MGPVCADSGPMNHGEERVLVIHDGSLAAMVACLMAPSLGEVVAWLPAPGSLLRGRGAGEAMQDALAVQQAEILGLGRLVRAGSIAPLPPDGVASGELQRSSSVGGGIWRGMARSIELLLAIAHAREHRCRRVIWPVICDGSIDAMFEVTERATLVTRLAWLDPPGEEEIRALPPGAWIVRLRDPRACSSSPLSPARPHAVRAPCGHAHLARRAKAH